MSPVLKMLRGEAIDDGAAEEAGEGVVDERADVGTERGDDDDEEDVHGVVVHQGEEGCWGHHHFGGEGDEGAFHGHEHEHPPVVEVLQDEVDERLHG